MLFWTLTHILSDPKLKQAVISETAQARQPDGQFSVDRLINHCPTLTAVWNECLRFYNAAAVIRCAEKHTVVGSKTVRPGDRVLGPFRLMHLSNDIFGPNSNEFDAYRWLRDKSLATKKGYYPFGGGHTYCPGRVVAKQEVCFFIATVLDRFEITPLGPKKDGKEEYRVPGISSKPVLTAMDPDADYLVSVSLKEA
jgi:cytochrome P450